MWVLKHQGSGLLDGFCIVRCFHFCLACDGVVVLQSLICTCWWITVVSLLGGELDFMITKREKVGFLAVDGCCYPFRKWF